MITSQFYTKKERMREVLLYERAPWTMSSIDSLFVFSGQESSETSTRKLRRSEWVQRTEKPGETPAISRHAYNIYKKSLKSIGAPVLLGTRTTPDAIKTESLSLTGNDFQS